MPQQKSNLAGLLRQQMAAFYFELVSKMLRQGKIDGLRIGRDRCAHASKSQRPIVLVPLCSKAPAITARICGVVVRSIGPIAPIHELCSGVFGVGVVIEHIQSREIAHSQNKSVFIDCSCQLVEIAFYFFFASTPPPRLAKK